MIIHADTNSMMFDSGGLGPRVEFKSGHAEVDDEYGERLLRAFPDKLSRKPFSAAYKERVEQRREALGSLSDRVRNGEFDENNPDTALTALPQNEVGNDGTSGPKDTPKSGSHAAPAPVTDNPEADSAPKETQTEAADAADDPSTADAKKESKKDTSD